jgi:transposase
MPAPYSNDLRQKVLDAIDRGERKSQVSRMFKISRNTIALWLERREAIGSVSAIVITHADLKAKLRIWSNFECLPNSMGI